MKIVVVGAGYVGLVTGTCLAESGNTVTCVDVDPGKIATLQAGLVPIYEPGLGELARRNAAEGRLDFKTSVAEAMRDAEVVFIAVGTPQGETGEVDLTQVLRAAEDIGRALERYTVVVNKSTVPVGGTERIGKILAEIARAPFDVVSNPEFLKEGSAVDDFMRPDRIVIGTASERARTVLAELFAPFVRTEQPILFMDARSAELTKYAANAMLATRISFINEMAALCERMGCDVDQVRRGMGSDRRIGHPFLFPGVGFGGSAFAKNVRAMMAMARQTGLDFDLLRAVERVNERQKRVLVDLALKHFGQLAGKRFGVWGLAYKPKTDDMRDAPSLTVIQLLAGAGAEVVAHDPVAAKVARQVLGAQVKLAAEPYAAAEAADALFLMTEWNEFRSPDYERLRRVMRGRVLFDGRNAWNASRARAAGFTYYGIGRALRGPRGGQES